MFKGPNYNNQVISSLRPPYYPEKVAEVNMNMKPLRRNYDYRRNPTYDTPNYSTSGYPSAFPSYPRYNSPSQYDVNKQPLDYVQKPRYEERPLDYVQKPRYEERPLPQSSGVVGPQNFVQDNSQGILLLEDQRHMTPAYRRKVRKQLPQKVPKLPVTNYQQHYHSHPYYEKYAPQNLNSPINQLVIQNEDEIENNFHDDRRRNLQSYFKGCRTIKPQKFNRNCIST